MYRLVQKQDGNSSNGPAAKLPTLLSSYLSQVRIDRLATKYYVLNGHFLKNYISYPGSPGATYK